MAKIAYPECGKIATTHGCHGGVKLESWCDNAGVLAALPAVYMKNGEQMQRYALKKTAVSGNMVYATLEGVDSMEAADALRGRILYAKREDLKLAPGVMLIAEMIGLPVYHAQSGEKLGEISDVDDTKAGRLYSIKTEGGVVLLPGVPEFVKEISEEGGMKVLPIPGFFDEGDEV